MMKYLILMLLLISTPLLAGDSGLYYNIERDGEGINLIRNGDQMVFYFYTYEPETVCTAINLPEDGLVRGDNCHAQRWFLNSGDFLIEDEEMEGWLYVGIGLLYPKCLVDAQDPFLRRCGEAHIVGRYIMSRYNDGWRMVVVRFGGILRVNDPLYTTVYEFNTPLFEATD
jgi:hypothetical protein